jgi:hypothetical protein
MNKIKLKLSYDFIEVLGHWLALQVLPPHYKFNSLSELAIQMQVSEIALQLSVFIQTPRENKKNYKISIIKSHGVTVLNLIYNYGKISGAYESLVLHNVKKQLEEHFFIKGPFKFPPGQLSL